MDNLDNLESNKRDVLLRYGPKSNMLDSVNEKIKEILRVAL